VDVGDTSQDGTPSAPAPTTRQKMTESVIDSLGAWTFIAAGIALLYMVWATLRILSIYVGGIPGVVP
jgi:hypothetical protein